MHENRLDHQASSRDKKPIYTESAMKLTKNTNRSLEKLVAMLDERIAKLPPAEQEATLKRFKEYAAGPHRKRRTTARNTRESSGRRAVSAPSA